MTHATGSTPSDDARFNVDQTLVFGAIPAEVVSDEPVERPGLQDEAAIAALPAGSALLVTLRGPGSGSRFLLDSDTVHVGRSERSDIFLDDVTVSRKHATFVRDGAGYAVRDSGSLNGTYVNRERVDTASLRTGDEVQIGKFRMVYFPSRRQPGASA
ncbi:FHA domain-containing protein [Sanguibacter sp. A247]|uniref:FHA domain-containing protein n=1 Tax=unclassified Sanguibacter TaxID=2645534 RepID=UPI003FD89405